ncbi:MAG: SDR family oxidoreductase, partial [Planctomycetales bacterium]|nr:SDR family oxidoreductase [Planctomycetales bacterium]
MDFLDIRDKTFLVTGVANRKSVAWHVARTLSEAGAEVVYVVRSQQRADTVAKLAPGAETLICDVEDPEQIERMASKLAASEQAAGRKLSGLLHSIAFADYEGGVKPFHET